jgi:hypothetical protein
MDNRGQGIQLTNINDQTVKKALGIDRVQLSGLKVSYLLSTYRSN